MKGLLAAVGVVLAVAAAPVALAEGELTVETQSGSTYCAVLSDPKPDRVICEGAFTQKGPRFNTVGTSGDGSIQWTPDMNMPGPGVISYMPMPYGQALSWGNWTIYPDESGTRFTNTRTGHGMFVSIENVYAF